MQKSETIKWFAGIAATVIAGITLWLITSSDSPLCNPPSNNVTKNGTSNTTDKTIKEKQKWEKNWKLINDPLPHLGAAGVSATNREKFLQIIQNLDFKGYENLASKKNTLVQLIKSSPSYNDPYYNMVVSKDVSQAFDELKILVRNIAIEKEVKM